MSTTILIIGEGLLADYVSDDLARHYELVRYTNIEAEMKIPEETALALVLQDHWAPSTHKRAEDIFRPRGISWLRGFVAFGEGLMGPLVQSDQSGCSQCADLRLTVAGRDRRQMWEMRKKLDEAHDRGPDVWASRLGLKHMSELMVSEAQNIVRGNAAMLVERMMIVQLKTLVSTSHFILPDSRCTVCGTLPEDSATAAHISLNPSPKLSRDTYRCRSLDELSDSLTKSYLDTRTGLLNGKMLDLNTPFADAAVNMPMFAGDEGVGGRTHIYDVSEWVAILEGLERSCGLTPGGKRTAVHDCYHHLQDVALNPLKVGVHTEEQYAQPGFPFKAFDPHQKMNWVWGYSFLQQRAILVPELLAYYSLGGQQGFVYETSNGCALGGTLEEAIFYAMMEVIERDSFLMTWYARLTLPRLDLEAVQDTELQHMVERVRAVAGYDLYVYNATMEHGVPSVFAIAKNRKPRGLNVICAAGAHLDPVRAVKGAIHELAAMMAPDDKLERNQDKYRRMLHDSSLVKEMEDHGMLYGLPQAEERLHFLLKNRQPMRTFEDEFRLATPHEDLTDDLKGIMQQFTSIDLDVIVVDQTTPEIRGNGLYCVKVIMPGMLPMTFGHHLTRLTGLERVRQVPVQLGYATQPLTDDQLNPYPHPFP
ncbi:TOMM precursor leader peptide-binding protein [Caldalkalibacillus salinus]|uniref:TOMM precursor leader peptide-binding protein n=1 Tax=Caldalkalibacillus salinus TaxID=2803787 RepID=UPI001920886C|nr:TOMM precursor leader peptide-binding protein [Caldalkalibacillus salinus]